MCVDARANPTRPTRLADDEPLILIVEGNSVAAEALSRHLDRLGYRTDVAGSGATAIQAAIDRVPNLILLG
ncbi:MAG: hypothetical protein KDA63_14410, partial [Planctomycetales bacterium]|nr:hypothetical protein [Planctomycetales bacterium]